MVFTLRFKILLALFAALLVVAALLYNQLMLSKRLDLQSSFDNKVMKNDEKIWTQLQKMASESAKAKVSPSPTPTPKLLVGKKLTK